MRLVDLTYAFDSLTIFWPTEKGFQLEQGFKGMTQKGYFYSANKFYTAEHGGTHLDAPIHFYEGRNSVDEVDLKKLIGQGIVVDVSEKCRENRDYRVIINDFEEWEKKNGKIEPGSILLIKTGFEKTGRIE